MNLPPDGDRRRDDSRTVVKRAMRLPLAYRFRLAARLARSRRVPWRARVPLGAALVYVAMPLDIIPDFIPVIGQLDDLLVAGIAVWWLLRTCPPEIALAEVARLEQRPTGRSDRALPWLLLAGGATLTGLLLLYVLSWR